MCMCTRSFVSCFGRYSNTNYAGPSLPHSVRTSRQPPRFQYLVHHHYHSHDSTYLHFNPPPFFFFTQYHPQRFSVLLGPFSTRTKAEQARQEKRPRELKQNVRPTDIILLNTPSVPNYWLLRHQRSRYAKKDPMSRKSRCSYHERSNHIIRTWGDSLYGKIVIIAKCKRAIEKDVLVAYSIKKRTTLRPKIIFIYPPSQTSKCPPTAP